MSVQLQAINDEAQQGRVSCPHCEAVALLLDEGWPGEVDEYRRAIIDAYRKATFDPGAFCQRGHTYGTWDGQNIDTPEPLHEWQERALAIAFQAVPDPIATLIEDRDRWQAECVKRRPDEVIIVQLLETVDQMVKGQTDIINLLLRVANTVGEAMPEGLRGEIEAIAKTITIVKDHGNHMIVERPFDEIGSPFECRDDSTS